MATPKRPYAAVRLGIFDDVLAAGVSESSGLLLARILTHSERRSIPGLLRTGVAGLAESLQQPLAKIQRGIAELEAAGFILFDRAERLLYVTGAIDGDGPRTENALKGMATQLRGLPPRSVVTRTVRQAIEGTLAIGERPDQRRTQWLELVGPEPNPDAGPDPNPGPGPSAGPDANPDAGPLRSRRPKTEAETETEDPDGPAIHAFLKFFCESYAKHRRSAKYHLQRTKEVPLVRQLLKLYGDVELRYMAEELLTVDQDFIAQTDRGIGILSLKASWLSDAIRRRTHAGHDVNDGTVWGSVLDQLRGRLSTWNYGQWFGSTHEVSHDGSELVVAVEGKEHAQYVRSHFAAELRDALEAAGVSLELVFRPTSTAVRGPAETAARGINDREALA